MKVDHTPRIVGGCSLHKQHDPAKCPNPTGFCSQYARVVDCCEQAPDTDVSECITCGLQFTHRCNFDEEYS